MKLRAMSRRFPPDYKRRWYIFERKDGKLVVRWKGATLKLRLASLEDALDVCGVEVAEYEMRRYRTTRFYAKSCRYIGRRIPSVRS